jgi:hypothetical protein
MTDDERARDTLPPSEVDEACRAFETVVREYGENDARLERLRFLADLDARDAYLRKS